jgi:hypothetical protein
MQRLLWARIPVAKFTEAQTGVDCDVCVANREGVFKSEVLREMSRLDHRFPDLVRLVRRTPRCFAVVRSCGRFDPVAWTARPGQTVLAPQT